jgi:hypothetical protein
MNQSPYYPGQSQPGFAPPPDYQQYPLPPQYQPPPPQPKKKPNKLVGIAVAFVIVIIVIAVAANGNHSNSNTGTVSTPGANTTPVSTQASTNQNQHFKVGDVVTVGSDWKATVNSITTNPGSAYEQPQKGVFVVVNISLTNISNKEQDLSSLLSFKFKASDGTEYHETFLVGTDPSPNGKVEAGGITKGDLVYDVPTSANSFTLSFAPDPFSSGQTIWDLNL